VKVSHFWAKYVWVSVIAIVIATPLFWVEGGCNWLQTKVFPPKRPRFMPVNSVWIDAPSLPISWHHGWWFGCGFYSSGTNYCRLVGADGQQVYGGEYLPCDSNSPINDSDIRLVPPPDSSDMWLFSENSDAVVGFLADGDLLLPLSVRQKCSVLKTRLRPARQ
jgi:hypothetical protein